MKRPTSDRTRRALIAVAACLALSGAVAVAPGAADTFTAKDMAVNAGIGCYDQASLRANTTHIGPTADPVAACAALWSQGAVMTGSSTPPPLVACTGKGLPVRVFPGSSTAVCDRLGLVPLPADYAAAGAAFEHAYEARKALGEMPIPATDCASPQAVADQVRAQLAAVHSDVAVTVEGSGPCVADGYFVVGDHIAVRTTSAAEASASWTERRVDATLQGLFGRIATSCQSPAKVARAARHRLANAGLSNVKVRVRGSGPCANSGRAYNPAKRVMTIFARQQNNGSDHPGALASIPAQTP